MLSAMKTTKKSYIISLFLRIFEIMKINELIIFVDNYHLQCGVKVHALIVSICFITKNQGEKEQCMNKESSSLVDRLMLLLV